MVEVSDVSFIRTPNPRPCSSLAASSFRVLAGVENLRLLQIVYSPSPVFVFMWLMAWRKSIGQVRQMLGRAAVWSIIRLLMFPNTNDRFVVWAYILIAITMLTTIRKQRIPVLPKSNNMEAFQPEKRQPF